jgi:hypothetical protein
MIRRALAKAVRRLRREGIDRLVVDRSAEALDPRRNAHRYVRDFLDRATAAGPNTARPFVPRIWIYWAQGQAQMPPIVRACFKQLCKTNPPEMVTFLDDQTIGSYADLPGYIFDKMGNYKAHFSDILRCALLAEHGGIWIDATCFCQGSLAAMAQEVLGPGFFAYRRVPPDPFLLSNWFMISRPGELIPELLRDALLDYWAKHDEPEHYFITHFTFEALYNLHAGFKQSWDQATTLTAYAPHKLQERLFSTFDQAEWDRILSLSTVHKLTHKFPESKLSEAGPRSYLAHVLSL